MRITGWLVAFALSVLGILGAVIGFVAALDTSGSVRIAWLLGCVAVALVFFVAAIVSLALLQESIERAGGKGQDDFS